MTGQGYRDGATVRRDRMLELIDFVERNQNTQESVYQGTVETHMFLKFGLKRRSTQELIHELELANVLRIDKNGRYWTRMTLAQIIGYISPSNIGFLPDPGEKD
jgi:hypothetical protein